MTGTAEMSSGSAPPIGDLVPLLARIPAAPTLVRREGPAARSRHRDHRPDRDHAGCRRSATPTSSRCCFTVRTATGLHRYQLWIGWTWHAAGPARARGHRRGGRSDRIRRAVTTLNVSALLLAAIDENRDFGSAGLRSGPARAGRAASTPRAEGLVIGAEQSNTSIVYGHSAILKVFRRLEPGPEPGRRDPPGAARGRLHAHRAAARRDRRAASTSEETTLAPAHRVLRQQRGGLGDGDRQRAGPDERGRPARRRGRRRLRRRVATGSGEAVAAVHAELAQAFGTTVAPHDELVADPRPDAAPTPIAAIDLVPSLAEHREPILRRVRPGRRTTRAG